MKIIGSLSHTAHPIDDRFASDEDRYDWQMSVRANYLLLGDTNVSIPIDIMKAHSSILKTNIRFLNKQELITGSFMSSTVQGSTVLANDVDIYFKSKVDAEQFLQTNFFQLKVIHRGENAFIALDGDNDRINVIFSVSYDSPEDLISHFDIRACSIALDPNTNMVYAVKGSFSDCCEKRLVYNPVPHNTTVARLIKYTEKGFTTDPYQRLFFSELIKSDQYNPDLELTTGYRGDE